MCAIGPVLPPRGAAGPYLSNSYAVQVVSRLERAVRTGAVDDWTGAQKANLVARILGGELTVQTACERHSLTPERIREWVLTYRRSAREALDAQLSQALARQGIDTEDLNAAEFSGPLADIPVAELLQTVALGRKDAVIVVSHRAEESRIWCVAGQIVDAESGRLTGELAVYRILGIDAGQLQGDFRAVQRVRVVHASTQALLLEAARHKDESALLLDALGDPATIYVPAPRALAAGAATDPALLGVLRQFNPGCTVEQVLGASERGDLETLSAISTLIQQRYLVPDEALTLVRQTLKPAQPTAELTSVGSLIAHARSGAAPERSLSVFQGAGLGLVLLTSFALMLWAFGMHRFTRSAPAAASRPDAVVALPPPAASLEASPPAQIVPDTPAAIPAPATPQQPAEANAPHRPTPVAGDATAPAGTSTASLRRPDGKPAPQRASRVSRRAAAPAPTPPVVSPKIPAAEAPAPAPAAAIESAPERQPSIQLID